MARSFSNAKLLSVIVVNGLSNATSRRGYAASSQGIMAAVARGRGSAARMLKKPGEEMVGSTEKVSWVPDPVTGYYKPQNRGEEIDVAELRALLLNNKH